jgi:peptide/nickel transport system substrate-binding protein
VREAIYDGPFDLRGYRPQPVILETVPATTNGDVILEPVQVQLGDPIVDGQGYLATVAAGISYLPSGCSDPACAQAYSGSQPVSMDQLVIRFKLKPGITWSDGTPLKAGDSVYSYTVARSLFSDAQSDLLAHTASYRALDDTTLEWRGVPGYRAPLYSAYFFSPLPEHAWGQLSPQELLTDERSARLPLGWGSYVIDEWISGDHLTR